MLDLLQNVIKWLRNIFLPVWINLMNMVSITVLHFLHKEFFFWFLEIIINNSCSISWLWQLYKKKTWIANLKCHCDSIAYSNMYCRRWKCCISSSIFYTNTNNFKCMFYKKYYIFFRLNLKIHFQYRPSLICKHKKITLLVLLAKNVWFSRSIIGNWKVSC